MFNTTDLIHQMTGRAHEYDGSIEISVDPIIDFLPIKIRETWHFQLVAGTPVERLATMDSLISKYENAPNIEMFSANTGSMQEAVRTLQEIVMAIKDRDIVDVDMLDVPVLNSLTRGENVIVVIFVKSDYM